MKYLTYFELRSLWFEFWEKKNHKKRKSTSLISEDDSLLWINSGVAGLKDFFLGKKKLNNLKIVNIQKSVRTNDLTNIGLTNRHLTFFEMLGNFSIGDYFKKEALEWALEFLIEKKWLNFNKNKLYITYFKEDKESLKILINKGIEKKHLIPMSKKSNFWDLGVGPCGPNVEIYYDLGEKFDKEKKGIFLLKNEVENDRYLEIWNIVFSQFLNLGNNEYKLLEKKNIDTGAGLERILLILQKKNSIFETDLFDNSLIFLEKIFNKKINLSFEKEKDFNLKIKIVLDHVRSITFLIADLLEKEKDINFQNKRGYVLRKIIRNASLKLYFLNIKIPMLFKISECVVKKYSLIYENIFKYKNEIFNLIKKEELLFFKLFEKKVLFNFLKIKNKFIDGKYIFDLVSSYGIPLEIIKEISNNNNLKLDIEKFINLFNEHKKISNKKDRNFMDEYKLLYLDDYKETFFDETKNELFAKVLGIFENNKKINSSNSQSWIIFDKTPFYAQKGGQSFDVGEIIFNNISNKILDVRINIKKQILHKVNLKTKISINDIVKLKIDIKKRNLTRKNHSSTHLLHSLLINQISNKINQKGSFNNYKYLRLDFFSPISISKKEIIEIEKKFKEIINKKINSEIFLTTYEKAKKMGALFFFEDFYDFENVRVVKFENFSIELCGGTHVSNTFEIEDFKIIEFKSISKNIYRIYAITSNEEINEIFKKYLEDFKKILDNLEFKIKYINDLEIYKKINIFKNKPKNFINYKEKFEIFKKLILVKFKNKKRNEIKNIVMKYKIPKKDIEIKDNFKFIVHKISNDIKEKNDFLLFLFNLLKKEKKIFICLIIELKINFNKIVLIDKTNNNINWIKILEKEFNKNIFGGGDKKKFIGLIKNIEINKIFKFIKNKI